MGSLTGVLLLLLLIAASLTLVSLVNRIQTRNRLVRQRVQHLTKRINELEELCAAIEPLLESTLIPKLINEEIIQLIETVQRLDPEATYLEVKLDQAKQMSQQFASGQRNQALNRLLSSDAAIARSKHYINEVANELRKLQGQAKLQNTEMEGFVQELTWTRLMVEVISHIGHGHKAVARKDFLVAYGYYRKAQNLMINSQHKDERRHQMIKQIGELLKNKRASISEDYMPETEFNPSQNVMQLPDQEEVLDQVNPGDKLVGGV